MGLTMLCPAEGDMGSFTRGQFMSGARLYKPIPNVVKDSTVSQCTK